GNKVGTNAAGTAALPNALYGVWVTSSGAGTLTNTTIGGTTAAERNIISGNGSDGGRIEGSATTGTVVEGNYIGTNAAGNTARANAYGVEIAAGASNTTVGGTTAGARNVISGNVYGITVSNSGGAPTGIVIQGNRIGTSADGNSVIANLTG